MFYYPCSKMLTLSEIVYHTARCSRCDQIKTRDGFGPDKRNRTGLQSGCRQCDNNKQQEYRRTDHGRDMRNISDIKYRLSNKGRQKHKEYKQSDHGRFIRSKSRKERLRSDPKFKMTEILRNRLRHAIRRTKHGSVVKSARTLDMLGCSMDEFIKHIEQQFQPGMSWENHGAWHIDHVLPCASFDLTDPAQQKTCFNFSNMQPLWAEDNIKKGCRLNVQHANTV